MTQFLVNQELCDSQALKESGPLIQVYRNITIDDSVPNEPGTL